MRKFDILNEFVRGALIAGRSKEEIGEALDSAGWSAQEIQRGLGQYDDRPFIPPIPRPQVPVSAQEMFIYAVLFTALAFTANGLVSLAHAAVDLLLPEPVDHGWFMQRAYRSLWWSMATLIVASPVFFWMTLITERRIRKDHGLRNSPVRKWLTYVTLFFAALIFCGDVTYLIFNFLNGELTLRFMLKALAVAVVSIWVFGFYLRDVQEVRHAG